MSQFDINTMLPADTVLKLSGSDTGFVSYDDLMNIKSTKDLFRRFNKLILLYIHHKDPENLIGHYTALINHPNSIEFFDSYAMKPDDILMMKSKKDRESTDQPTNHLARLLYNSGRTIEYNDLPLQSKDLKVATCGVWSGLRCHYSEIPLNTWMDIWKQLKSTHKGKELDRLAVRMAKILLNK